MYVRDDMADLRISVNGIPFFGSWATLSGGDKTSTDAKTRAGGMGDEVSTGGPSTRNDMTCTIQWTDEVLAQYKLLDSLCGNGRVKASLNWLGPDKRPIAGGLFTRTGSLKGVSDPNYDHNGNAVGFLSIVVSCDEQLA